MKGCLATLRNILLIVISINIVDCREAPNKNIRIAVNQYVEHPNLEEVYTGFVEIIDKWSQDHHLVVRYDRKIAGADPSVALQIARQQAAMRPNIILALATPSAQAAARATNSIPIIFGAITDPVSAGLVKSITDPGGNVTGTSDIGPYEKQIELIRMLLPKANIAGIIRNPGESNSVASMLLIDKAMGKYNIKKIEAAVSNTAEVLAAARSLVGRCDFIYLPADNTVLSALAAVANTCNANKIPLFVGDEGSVKLGGALTIGIDYYQLGVETGKIGIKILEGSDPAHIPVSFGIADKLIISVDNCKRQGLIIPIDMLRNAKLIGK